MPNISNHCRNQTITSLNKLQRFPNKMHRSPCSQLPKERQAKTGKGELLNPGVRAADGTLWKRTTAPRCRAQARSQPRCRHGTVEREQRSAATSQFRKRPSKPNQRADLSATKGGGNKKLSQEADPISYKSKLQVGRPGERWEAASRRRTRRGGWRKRGGTSVGDHEGGGGRPRGDSGFGNEGSGGAC